MWFGFDVANLPESYPDNQVIRLLLGGPGPPRPPQMHNHQLLWPLLIIGMFIGLFGLLIVGALPRPTVAQTNCPYPPADCAATQTSIALIQNPYLAPSPSPTNTPLPEIQQVTETATETAPALPTDTPTATSRTIDIPTDTPVPTSTAEPEVAPTSTSFPTPTSTLEGSDLLICLPGASITITGSAKPYSALLAYFNTRPVGGSFARRDGSYAVVLRIGSERPGLYPIEIRTRDGYTLIAQRVCQVPAVTPTATLVSGS